MKTKQRLTLSTLGQLKYLLVDAIDQWGAKDVIETIALAFEEESSFSAKSNLPLAAARYKAYQKHIEQLLIDSEEVES